ncbi:MAG TPA: tyrosine-type recombinase/integrase [Streptosporangiaceae bacterium]
MSQDNGAAAELASLAESWVTWLKSERKSPHTIRTYTTGVTLFLRWCDREDREPELTRAAVAAFTASLLGAGAEPGTALARQRGVRRFSAWLAAEHEIERDELVGMKPPKQDDKMPAELTTDQVKAILATCGKTPNHFHDIRDAAIIRLMTESMVRSGELLDMTVDDVDIRAGTALVQRGKGGKGRVVPFRAQTAVSLDRYARARRKHKFASSPAFWLGARGPLGYNALYATVKRRGQRAGVTVHPHMLRATGAIRWREAGGSVPGLLTVAGWSSIEMAARYVRAAESRLAVDEAHKLDLGDL